MDPKVVTRLCVVKAASHEADAVMPGYTRADAVVFFNVTERRRLQTNAENLLGTKYHINADGNNNISPGSPRAMRVTGADARWLVSDHLASAPE